MYKPMFLETEAVATDIIKNWNKLINSGEENAALVLGFEKMIQQNVEFVVSMYKNPGRINIALRVVTPQSLIYEVMTHDNTLESLQYAVDSIFGYAKNVMLSDIATPMPTPVKTAD